MPHSHANINALPLPLACYPPATRPFAWTWHTIHLPYAFHHTCRTSRLPLVYSTRYTRATPSRDICLRATYHSPPTRPATCLPNSPTTHCRPLIVLPFTQQYLYRRPFRMNNSMVVSANHTYTSAIALDAHLPHRPCSPPMHPPMHTPYRSGLGVLTFVNGDRYEGHWLADKKEGPGRHFYSATRKVYTGEWVDDVAKCGVSHLCK